MLKLTSKQLFSHQIACSLASAERKILLTLVLIKRNGFNLEAIKQEIIKRASPESYLPNQICSLIIYYRLFDTLNFESLNEEYQTREFLYNIALQPVLYSDLNKVDKDAIAPKYPNAKDISAEFYNGFGQDLLQA